jgi:Uma2 family endonuclease
MAQFETIEGTIFYIIYKLYKTNQITVYQKGDLKGLLLILDFYEDLLIA